MTSSSTHGASSSHSVPVAAASAHHSNHAGSIHRPASSAFQVPGHTLYLGDPQRLSVLSVNIHATTSMVTRRAVGVAPPPSQQRPGSSLRPPPPSAGSRHASTSKLHSPQPPPSSLQSASHKSSRSRPLSHDFGQKARDAFNEFGRLASRRTSAMERSNGADTLARVADGLGVKRASIHGDGHARSASLQPPSLQHEQQQQQQHQQQSSILTPPTIPLDLKAQHHVASDDAAEICSYATRSFSLVPHRDQRLASQPVPLSIQVSTTTSGVASSMPCPAEFISEPAAFSTGNAIPPASSFDPSQLLLKVQPPAELAREAWSRSASFLPANSAANHHTSEEHAIKFHFRLRLAESSATPPWQSSSRTDRIGAAAVPASRGLGQVLFLSAASPDKLAEAVESPQTSIASSELAALEGISRIEVTPSSHSVSPAVTRGARERDFEWTWKSLARSNADNGFRCCCAFVELTPDGKAATVLAAMSLYIQLPTSAQMHDNMLSSTSGETTPHRGVSHADSLAIMAALNPDPGLSPRTEAPPAFTTTGADSQSSGSAPNARRLDATPLLLDRTELSIEDLVNDSPIFRAAVVNLERRTVSMKRASKAVLRAAHEARTRLLRLVEAEEAVDVALEGLVGLAPETLGRLEDQFLRQARTASLQQYREQANIVEMCLERPLAQIVELCRVAQEGFKLFDNESKSYYSQTQKWLANRSNAADASPSPATSNDAPPQRHERADEKQKLRELRFEQARLDLFAMLQRLHGGRAEAHLTQSILHLSHSLADAHAKFDWSGPQQRSCLSAMDAGLASALDDQALQLQEVESRSRRIGDRIRVLEHALGKTVDGDADIVGAHRFETEQESLSPLITNGAVSSKARKFKSFLGAFAAGIQNSPLTLSKNASPNPNSVDKPADIGEMVSGERSQDLLPRRRHSMKVRSSHSQQVDASNTPPLRTHAPSSWVYDHLPAAPRRGSELQESSRLREDASPGQLALHASQDASDGGASSAGGYESSDARTAAQGLGIFAPASTDAVRGSDSVVVSKPFTSSPASTSATQGSERKKEGVLWVSTKPITGPAGADAPRGINRSNHWRECWVVLSGSGQISEFADWKNARALEPTNALIDLRFATVREARGVDRRFAFEIVTRDSRRFFQAPDEAAMRDWMRAISKAIESLLNGTSSVRKLDRAVRASPFRNLDSAQRSAVLDDYEEEPGTEEGNDFAVRKLLDLTAKGSSQSMTDLSASAKVLGSDRTNRIKGGGHLAALSESHAEVSARSSRRGSQHVRGISNKTPISGYIGAGGCGLSAADAAALHRRDDTAVSDDASISSRSANGEQDAEFDRQIEAVIHRSYGSHDGTGTSHSGFSHSSGIAGVNEMGELQGDVQGDISTRGTSSNSPQKRRAAANGSVSSMTTSSKMGRSAEIAAISRRPENQRCADCQDSDPRWASWMLVNEPCCIFICIGCSGVHRSLGVHISKVKSVDLDDWTEEQLQAARDWGNVRANAVWEHSKPAGLLPQPKDRKEFWRRKYIDQEWKDPNPTGLRKGSISVVAPSNGAVQETSNDDVDATPTRRSVAVTGASPIVASPGRKSQTRAKEVGLRITPGHEVPSSNGSATLSDGLGSPKPIGPRPLPLQRRSVSMQAASVSSPLHSPQEAEQFAGIDQGPRNPLSPSKYNRPDWAARPTLSPRKLEDDVEDPTGLNASTKAVQERVATAFPTSSASVPYLSTLATANPHVSKAMLAARADPRLFPSPAPIATTAEPYQLQPPIDAKLQQASSPPSSFFVSNLGGRMPSPMFFEGPLRRGGAASWDTASETETDGGDERGGRLQDRSPVNTHAPARFEAFTSEA